MRLWGTGDRHSVCLGMVYDAQILWIPKRLFIGGPDEHP